MKVKYVSQNEHTESYIYIFQVITVSLCFVDITFSGIVLP